MPELLAEAAPLARRPRSLRDEARFALRAVALVFLLIYGLWLAAIVRLDPSGRLRPEPLAQHWSRWLLALLGVRVRVDGAVSREAGLIVANHVSWLDIPLLYAHAPVRFVSKSEVRHWPLAGWLADAAGTFYLRRGQHGVRPLLARLVPWLRGGGLVAVFPEGTTSDGNAVLPFHPRLFGAAVESGTPVQPVALRYHATAHGEHLAPFVGDDDLVSHLMRLLRNPRLDAHLSFCADQPVAADSTRDGLCGAARQAICAVLSEPPAA